MKYLIWDEELMIKSFEFLKRMRALGIDFVLIGGWAVYFLTKYHMSRDIDIVLQDREFWKLKTYILGQGGREKASGLKKMGFSIEDVKLDVYTESKSGLPIPIDEIYRKQIYVVIEDIKILKPEQLLVLKQKAAEARGHNMKGLKDRCDILAICLKAELDFSVYKAVCSNYSMADMPRKLQELISSCEKEFNYVIQKEIIPSKLKRMKKDLKKKIGRIKSSFLFLIKKPVLYQEVSYQKV